MIGTTEKDEIGIAVELIERYAGMQQLPEAARSKMRALVFDTTSDVLHTSPYWLEAVQLILGGRPGFTSELKLSEPVRPLYNVLKQLGALHESWADATVVFEERTSP